MKTPKIIRPEIVVEYVGIKSFFYALYAICKVGLIRKCGINITTKIYTLQVHGFDGGTCKRIYFYIVPKYKFKRVSEIRGADNDT